MNNIEIEKLKKSFLDGKITALEYEAKVKILENQIKATEASETGNIEFDSSIKKEDTSYKSVVMIAIAVMVIIFILFAINFRLSTPKPLSFNNIENNIDTGYAKIDSMLTPEPIEDSLSKSERLAEEAAFMKTKAGRIYKKHPEWSKYDCERLADNSIWIGMDIDMLKYKRGLPNSANPSNYGSVTQWQWCWSDYTPSCFYDNDGDGKIDSYN